VDVLVAAMVPVTGKVLKEGEEIALWSIITTAKSQSYEVSTSKGKPARGANISATLSDDKQL